MWGNGWGWGAWMGMMVMMVVFWGLIIFGIIALVRYVGGFAGHEHRHPADGGPRRPEDLLAERFARGEIEEDDYKRRLELLRTGR